jgi:outer membrane protein assembly factor BamB
MKQTLRQLAHWTLAVAAIVLFAGCKTKVANETKQVADETKQTAGETTQTEGETKAVASDPGPASTVALAEWPMWGGTINRNMVSPSTGLNFADFQPPLDDDPGRSMIFQVQLGSQTYGNPVIGRGVVLVGTNNGAGYRPKHKGDRGVVLCFDRADGKLLWQLTREKLTSGRVNDWPLQGICSSPAIDGNRAYVVTNRCELMCVDLEGFHDGENDGDYQTEVDTEELDADIVWSLDMIEEYGVFPHNLATSSPVIYGDLVYILTSNGVDEAHLEIPSPRSPSFMAVNKNTGDVVWTDNTPFDKVLHGQWGSAAIGIVDGKAQIYFPGGDGWLYALDGLTGEHIWKFDLNPKDSVWELGGAGSRNAIISTPVFYNNSVFLAVGQDPEHGEGVGHLYRIDATKTGDVSPMLDEDGDGKGEPNPNSAMIWYYGGEDEDGTKTGRAGSDVFRRTLSTVAISNGIVYAADLSGRLHAVDHETGERLAEVDVLAGIWGSPLVVDGHLLLGDEDGDLAIYKAQKDLPLVREITFNSSIYSTATIVDKIMYVTDRSRLYAISLE